MEYTEFKTFIKKEWAPNILTLHQPSGDTITDWARDVIQKLQTMPTHKVCAICTICKFKV